jgi:transporter family protein
MPPILEKRDQAVSAALPTGRSAQQAISRGTVEKRIENWDRQIGTTLAFSRVDESSSSALRSKWFWYSLLSLLCWTAWALTAKIGCSELPPASMQFLSAFGFLLVSAVVAGFRKKSAESSDKETRSKGKLYSIVSGILLATGGIALFAAYRTGENTAAITGITSLYPVITVLCAVVILKEKLSNWQILGLCFSGVAILLLSF